MSQNPSAEPHPTSLDGPKTNCQINLEQFLIENNLYQPQTAGVPMNLPGCSSSGITSSGMVWSNQGIPNPILIPRQNTTISVDNDIPAVLIEKKRGVTFAPNPIYHPAPTPTPPVYVCENCPALVRLMYNYMVEMCGGLHAPITTNTTGDELFKHLSEAFCYNVGDIQGMIRATELPYRCRICHYAAFATRTELLEHIKTGHPEALKVPCPQCSRLFKTKQHVQAHIRRMHEPKPVKEFRCSVQGCNKEYANIKTFQKHITVAHPEVTLHINPIPNVGFAMNGAKTETSPTGSSATPETEHGKGQGKAKGGVFGKQAAQHDITKATKAPAPPMKKTRRSKSVRPE